MGKDLKFTNLSTRDFLYRLECKDKFIRDIINDNKTIVAINKLKREMEFSASSRLTFIFCK